jgi:hypothetical protein
MSLTDRIPDNTKDRIRNILKEIRARAVELQDTAEEVEGLFGIFLNGVASRIVNLIDIVFGEL